MKTTLLFMLFYIWYSTPLNAITTEIIVGFSSHHPILSFLIGIIVIPGVITHRKKIAMYFIKDISNTMYSKYLFAFTFSYVALSYFNI